MNFGIEFVVTVAGGLITTGVAVFGIMRKISHFADSVSNNSKSIEVVFTELKEDRKRLDAIELLKKDLDGLTQKVLTNERRIEGLGRDVMELSNHIIEKLADELKPIAKSIELLTEKSIQIDIESKYMKEAFDDMKNSIKEISHEMRNRACINHNKKPEPHGDNI